MIRDAAHDRDVLARFAKLPTPSTAELRRFVERGVPIRALHEPDVIRKARVVFVAPAAFCFEDEARDEGEIVPAFAFAARNVAANICDLVAWHPASGRLANWVGRVGCLGEEAVAAPRFPDPLVVYPDPLAWLRASRDGVVIVDRRRAGEALDGFSLATDTDDQAAVLVAMLTRPAPVVYVASPLARAA